MRRITIWADDDTAKQVVQVLEAKGVDYMSEDFAEPTIKRREVPERRVKPEVVEQVSGMLKPLKTSSPVEPKKVGKKLGPVAVFILQLLKEAPGRTKKDIVGMCTIKGWSHKRVGDVLYRLLETGKVTTRWGGAVVNANVYNIKEDG